MFYPLFFESIYKDRIWGGTKLQSVLNKNIPSTTTGESWELSVVEKNVSRIANGDFKGKFFDEVLACFPSEFLGFSVVARFGSRFPLLFKFIDAKDDLSIQVHPDDNLAMNRHQSLGKTEMWYILQAEPDAKLIVGFREKCSAEKYVDYLSKHSLPDVLNEEKVAEGDVFFIVPGTIHAIGKGVLLAEIQQSSDITYRIYDYDRIDIDGNPRALHTDLALDAMNYDTVAARKFYKKLKNQSNQLVTCTHFSTNLLLVDGYLEIQHNQESFRVYMCVDGSVTLACTAGEFPIQKGTTVFVPAIIDHFMLRGNGKLLETYIP